MEVKVQVHRRETYRVEHIGEITLENGAANLIIFGLDENGTPEEMLELLHRTIQGLQAVLSATGDRR